MHRLALIAAFASAAISLPAMAQDKGFYVGGELGLALSTETDMDFTPATTAGTSGSMVADHDLGFLGAAFIGHDFGLLRVEAEASYLSADIDEVTSDFSHPTGLAAGSQSMSGDASARSFLLNLALDFGQPDRFSFFVGGGAGKARIKVSRMALQDGGTVLLDHWDSRFAWQGTAGVRKRLSGKLELHARYRYLHVGDVEMVGFGGRAVEAQFTSHSLAAGVTYRFH